MPLTADQEKAFKRQESKIDAILMTGRFADQEEQQKVDDFYSTYFLARWTLLKNLSHLHDFRNKDLRNHLAAAQERGGPRSSDALVLDFMKKLAAGNYHPAVRVNAMLAIGELNSVEPTPNTPAVPLPEALKVLLAAVESSKLPDGVRAAAMVGIRASRGGGDPGRRRPPIAHRRHAPLDGRGSADGSRRARPRVDPRPGRRDVGAAGFGGRRQRRFQGNAQDGFRDQASFLHPADRGGVVGTIELCGRRRDRSRGGGGRSAQFAIDACVDELGRTNEGRRRRGVATPIEAASGRRVGGAARQIAPLAQEPQRPLIEELQKDLKDLSDLLDDNRHKDENMKPRVEELRKKLEAWLQKKPA